MKHHAYLAVWLSTSGSAVFLTNYAILDSKVRFVYLWVFSGVHQVRFDDNP